MPEQEKKEATTYHVSRLISEAQDRFGVSSHVAAGAFSGSRKQNLTLDEGKSLIERFAKRPVETDNQIGEEG